MHSILCNLFHSSWINILADPPFVSPTNDQEELFETILSGQFEFASPYWDDATRSAKDLIVLMLQTDPELRYSAVEVLQHRWVTEEDAADEDEWNRMGAEARHFDMSSSCSPLPSTLNITTGGSTGLLQPAESSSSVGSGLSSSSQPVNGTAVKKSPKSLITVMF